MKDYEYYDALRIESSVTQPSPGLPKAVRFGLFHTFQAAARDGSLRLPKQSSLWLMVQGRRVFVYGCVPKNYRDGSLREQLGKIPGVEVAVEDVTR